MAPMKQLKLPLLNSKAVAAKSKTTGGEKENIAVASWILLASNSSRDIPVSLFSHEVTQNPPSLSKAGTMYHGSKSELVPAIASDATIQDRPNASSVVVDGALMVHLVHPKNTSTIGEYLCTLIAPYVLRRLQSCTRMDIVFDRYENLSN
jgi:hypothetical protein